MERHVVTCDRCKLEDDGNHQRATIKVTLPFMAAITNGKPVDLCKECCDALQWELEEFMKPKKRAQ